MSRDFGREAHLAAEAHLDAIYEHEATGEGESPAWGPWCGCQDCLIREVLYAAWPSFQASVKEGEA